MSYVLFRFFLCRSVRSVFVMQFRYESKMIKLCDEKHSFDESAMFQNPFMVPLRQNLLKVVISQFVSASALG